ncbi:hypothetical protein PoB_003272900 [Plakobranchus ocellatus]|uniref:Uncharacterized protein n=1 Tax=Plakobranchus ocellatus TaxID=259542 RepID=A0AAV4AIZ4_9GAST|nr:hypothetical protein PoB_003272900 [Plakobranchus ocellatus]
MQKRSGAVPRPELWTLCLDERKSHIWSKATYDTNVSKKEHKATRNRNATQREKQSEEANKSSSRRRQTGRQALWRDNMKVRHSALSRIEPARKDETRRRKHKRISSETRLN